MQTSPLLLSLLTSTALIFAAHSAWSAEVAAAASGEAGLVRPWGTLANGRTAHLYTLNSSGGLQAVISDYGATVVGLTTPDRQGALADINLGYATLAEYLAKGHSPYFGAVVGRYGNRIADGKFALDGATYTLAKNNVPNGIPCHLHGGNVGFDKVLWTAKPITVATDPGLELRYISPDGDEGYPGNLDLTVTYVLTVKALKIDYRITTDRATPVNVTFHGYFNLHGEGVGTINDHTLQIAASRFTPVDKGLIPTGVLAPVAKTNFDFLKPTLIGARVNAKDDEQLNFGGGYDHNWVLDKAPGAFGLAARLAEPTSGRVVEVWTDQPGLQFYGGNFLPKATDPAEAQNIGKSGKPYRYRSGLCLETQHFPDSPNQPEFPTTILRPGQVFHSTTEYRFSVE